MIENIRLAFQGIWSHKLRSFLTMLGVIIGIASIIAIISTIRGTDKQIEENLIGAGNNNVNIKLMQGDWEYQADMGAPSGITIISDEQKEEIRSIEGVEDATFYTKMYAYNITNGANRLEGASAYGVDQKYLSTCGYKIVSGRGFIESDYTEFRKVILLDMDSAATLFESANPLGKTIEINGEPFTIIGTIKKSEKGRQSFETIQEYLDYLYQNGSMVLMPISSWPIVFSFDPQENTVIKTSNTDFMTTAGRSAEEILNRSITNPEESEVKYKAEDLLQIARNKQELSKSTNNLLLWIASISLLVGGIGVMNIMLVSVTERTSEIGLKKAVGARKRRIMWQFLTESAVLTSVGGIIGIIAGVIMAFIISNITETMVVIWLPAVIIAVVFSMLIGIVFGLIPSVKAANLNPIDALRHE